MMTRRKSLSLSLFLIGIPQIRAFLVIPKAFSTGKSSLSMLEMLETGFASQSVLHDKKSSEEWDFDDIDMSEIENFKPIADLADLDGIEKAWRYAKKPLLRIGSKGATLTHGNSLRQLLEDHTAVKVKVNTRRFDSSLETAFNEIRTLVEESGGPKGIELLQARNSENIILFGMPGTKDLISKGEFPPEIVESEDDSDESD